MTTLICSYGPLHSALALVSSVLSLSGRPPPQQAIYSNFRRDCSLPITEEADSTSSENLPVVPLLPFLRLPILYNSLLWNVGRRQLPHPNTSVHQLAPRTVTILVGRGRDDRMKTT